MTRLASIVLILVLPGCASLQTWMTQPSTHEALMQSAVQIAIYERFKGRQFDEAEALRVVNTVEGLLVPATPGDPMNWIALHRYAQDRVPPAYQLLVLTLTGLLQAEAERRLAEGDTNARVQGIVRAGLRGARVGLQLAAPREVRTGAL